MSIADELAKLEELRRQRVISKEEFEVAKKKVLSDSYRVDNQSSKEDPGTGRVFAALDLESEKSEDAGSVEEELEELRRQRVISKEELEIAKKKALNYSDQDDVPDLSVDVDLSDDLAAVDLATEKAESVVLIDGDQLGIAKDPIGDALDEMAERDLKAEQPGGVVYSNDHERTSSGKADRDILFEIDSLDRQWDLDREKYKITGKYGNQHTPSKVGSVASGVIVAAFGIFWTVMAASIGRGFGGVGALFPLFGLLFICVGVGASIWGYKKAEDYECAERLYRQRRRALEEKRR